MRIKNAIISAALAVAATATVFVAPVGAQPVDSPAQPTLEQEAAVDATRTEQVTPENLAFINGQLASVGNHHLAPGTVALEFRTDGTVIGYLADGSTYVRTPEADGLAMQLSIVKEIKKVVAGCLGVSLTATGFWASIEKELTNWDRAAKFLVRRLGLLGAVSCAGGIIWQYI